MATFSLPPRLDSQISDFLSTEKDTIFQAIEVFGSPVHFVFPQLLSESVRKFQEVFDQSEVKKPEIYFAAKVNKAESFAEEAAKANIGMDVSSIEELQSALGHGIQGAAISVSGPIKQRRLLVLAAQHGCTVSVDSANELDGLIALSNFCDIPKFSILIRLNGLSECHSRFGINTKNLQSVLSKIPPGNGHVDLKGFHFHLNGYSVDERVSALQIAIEELQKARLMGHKCNTINIGGGFAINYVDMNDWKNFESAKIPENFIGNKNIQSFYPYGNEQSPAQQLNRILSAQVSTHGNIANLLKIKEIQLAIEPGRSLVDQAGLTCMQIKGTKTASDATLIVEVDANINHLSEQWFGSEYCVDPIHMQQNPDIHTPAIEAAVGGNTCLEIDMLSWRKIGFTNTPKAGDLLVYANTAGYQMDSNESSFHQLPIPEKIAAFRKGGRWRWKKDSKYSFLDPL